MGFVIHDCSGYVPEDGEDFYYHGYDGKIEGVDEDLAEAGLVELNFDE